jgi:hypothetical protein
VVTLDLKKFDEKKQKRLHIGDMLSSQPYIRLHKHPSPVKTFNLQYDLKVESGKHIYLTYPPDTEGFLYYFTSPQRPRITGELRFRVASSDDLASFESGSDLLKRNGQLWRRPLIAVSKYYIPLYEKLKEELLVPDDLDAVLSTFPRRNLRYRQSQYLYTLNDTFIVYFSSPEQILTIITEQGMESIRFAGPFYEASKGRRRIPYTGSALVRFERSTLPKHKGTRTVVLRILKIITPVQCVIPLYDGNVLPPKEGELHQRYPYRKDSAVACEVWSLNIDKNVINMGRALRLLWDI